MQSEQLSATWTKLFDKSYILYFVCGCKSRVSLNIPWKKLAANSRVLNYIFF